MNDRAKIKMVGSQAVTVAPCANFGPPFHSPTEDCFKLAVESNELPALPQSAYIYF